MVFMRQDPGWTLADNSLSMELYYKDHLHLIETWNINFSKFLNIAGRIITTIITIIIIILATIIIDQIATSTFLAQVKPSFSSNTFRIIFILIPVSHSNTLQAEMTIFFAYFSDCSAKITSMHHQCITTLSWRYLLSIQDNFWPYAIC